MRLPPIVLVVASIEEEPYKMEELFPWRSGDKVPSFLKERDVAVAEDGDVGAAVPV